MKKTVFLFLFLLAIPTFHLFGQLPASYSFNDEERFEADGTYDLFEDDSANIWMSTQDGLYRYDGSSFKHFVNNQYAQDYSRIKQDKEGRIWCQNFAGQVFYVAGDELLLFGDFKDYFRSDFLYNVAFFPRVFVGSEYGLVEKEFGKEEIIKHHFNPRSIEGLDRVVDGDTLLHDPSIILGAKDSFLFLFDHVKIYKWDVNEHTSTILKEYERGWSKNPWIKNNDFGIILKNESQLALSIYDYETNSFSRRIFEDNFEMTDFIEIEGTNSMLMSYKGGVSIINEGDVRRSPNRMFHGMYVSDIMKDREGNIWVSTLSDGIFIIPDLQMQYIKTEGRVKYFLEVPEVGLLAFTSDGKIYQIDPTFEKIGDFEMTVEHPYYIPASGIIGVSNSPLGFDVGSRTIVKNSFGLNAKSVSFIRPHAAFFSQTAQLGIRSLHPLDTVVSFLPDPIKLKTKYQGLYFQSIRPVRSFKNRYDKENNCLYVCFSDGLFVYADRRETRVEYEGKPIIARDILLGDEGVLWIADTEGKLFKYRNGKVNYLLSLNASVNALDEWGVYLFCGSYSGVFKVNKKSLAVERIDECDGLLSNQVRTICIYEGTVYAATKKGLSCFAASHSQINEVPPLVQINGMTINSKEMPLQAAFELEHDQNNFVIYFGAVSHRSRGNFQFKYKMSGIDSSWTTHPSEINFARYPSVPPGEYVFELKAVNEDGVESAPKKINFSVAEPFYRKTSFYILIILFIVLVVSTIFIIRIRIIQRQNKLLSAKSEIEKQLSASQLTALRSQMNPHFVFNALNSVQDYIMNNRKELAGNYLGLFADLMRKYLNHSQEEELLLEEEIETLEMYLELEKVRFEETLTYEVDVDPEIDPAFVKMPAMLVQPFVENAIKHGLLHQSGERKLYVGFHKTNGELIIQVKDNGIGREASAKIRKSQNRPHRSFATSAIKRRVELLNQSTAFQIEITYVDLEPNGTEVKISIKS